MSDSASISAGIAARYATAVFDLALEAKQIADVERDIDTVDAALKESDDFRNLIRSPLYTRDQHGQAVNALAEAMGLGDVVGNTLRLMAAKRRLFVLPQMIAALRQLIADEKGEITAEVQSAKALTDAQRDALAAKLKASLGSDVNIKATVDERLIGGLIVKVGSKMIDSSIRSKLSALQNTMKEVG